MKLVELTYDAGKDLFTMQFVKDCCYCHEVPISGYELKRTLDYISDFDDDFIKGLKEESAQKQFKETQREIYKLETDLREAKVRLERIRKL